MKTLNQWLAEYGESHRNATNKKVHFICVPVIFFTVVGLLFCIKLITFSSGYYLTAAHIILLLVIIYYATLSIPIAIGMFIYGIVCLFICRAIQTASGELLWVSIALFALAWIAQFWGHKIEGKKPSFLKDLQFLLIGPAWIMSFIFRKIGIAL